MTFEDDKPMALGGSVALAGDAAAHDPAGRREPLRIGLVAGEFRPGLCSVSDYTLRLAAALRAAGNEVVVATTGPSVAAARSQSDGVPVVAVADDWHLIGVRRAARILRDLGLDVVHLQVTPSAYSYGGEIARLRRHLHETMPLVVTLHGQRGRPWVPSWLPGWLRRLVWGEEDGPAWDRETLRLAPGGDAVIVTDPPHVAGLWRRLPEVRDRLHYVPVGPSIPFYALPVRPARERLRSALGVDRLAPVVLSFGVVQSTAGIDLLLDVAQRLRRSRPGLRLVVAGSDRSSVCGRDGGQQLEVVESSVIERRLGDVVRSLGSLREGHASELLQAADVGVFPLQTGASLMNGSLLAALEHGLPLVASEGRPPDPVLSEGEAVHLAPDGDAPGLAVAIEEVLEQPLLARRLARRGRRLAAAHSWSRVAADHLEIYRDLLGQTVGDGLARPPLAARRLL